MAGSKHNGTMNQVMPRIAKLIHELAGSAFANIRFGHTTGLGWSVRVNALDLRTSGNNPLPLDAMYEFEDLLVEEVISKLEGYERCRAPHRAEVEKLNELAGQKPYEKCDQTH